ncbi:hypothetical protein [Streptomyces sp. WAC06273]|uniref:hypothetical protein n=1 Tax=Streptomyces sp. WAC06273 TaxID=2487422 RepID=UPI0021B06C9E|nr:hypothetical protein [Streptomyces sp. WAC06273]
MPSQFNVTQFVGNGKSFSKRRNSTAHEDAMRIFPEGSDGITFVIPISVFDLRFGTEQSVYVDRRV